MCVANAEKEGPAETTEHSNAHRNIGLALSGGGSRAIAFHLGCLRVLQARGLLDRIQVISSVSGGSVISAMYAYSDGNFQAFDERVIKFLRSGLNVRILRNFLFPPIFLASAPGTVLSGMMATGAWASRAVLRLWSRITGTLDPGRPHWTDKIQSPYMRRFTRALAFEKALSEVVGKATLSSERHQMFDVVINACELRTGTAFRFGSRESGCWRYGRLKDNNVPVSFAIAASAAYPVFLPPFDQKFLFVKDSTEAEGRVLLTDGGVFDNLGISCMFPDRKGKYGTNTFNPEYIICCNAGQGQFRGDGYPYLWPARMIGAFESVFRKATDANMSRLFDAGRAKTIKGFAMPYLGLKDDQVRVKPEGFVTRESVMSYPTNFSAMSEEMIERLTTRGEQLTNAMLDAYCPGLK